MQISVISGVKIPAGYCVSIFFKSTGFSSSYCGKKSEKVFFRDTVYVGRAAAAAADCW